MANRYDNDSNAQNIVPNRLMIDYNGIDVQYGMVTWPAPKPPNYSEKEKAQP
jgi:hypothetical protein